MLKAVIFDCFGVFYPDPVFTYMRAPGTSLATAEALHALDEQAARGNLSRGDFITQTARLLAQPPKAVEQQFFRSKERNDQLITLTQEFRKSYKVAMLSNIGGDMMDGFFSEEERQRLFDVVILSGNVKMAKPDRAIFELTCRQLDVQLSETVMVDDMQRTCDIVKGFGMQSICYKDFEQCKAELATITASSQHNKRVTGS